MPSFFYSLKEKNSRSNPKVFRKENRLQKTEKRQRMLADACSYLEEHWRSGDLEVWSTCVRLDEYRVQTAAVGGPKADRCSTLTPGVYWAGGTVLKHVHVCLNQAKHWSNALLSENTCDVLQSKAALPLSQCTFTSDGKSKYIDDMSFRPQKRIKGHIYSHSGRRIWWHQWSWRLQ